MQSIKEYKKGELIFKEGDSLDKAYIIQSGRVSLFLERSEKKIIIEQLTQPHIFGENAIFASPRAGYSVEAIANCKILEVPVALFKAQNETAPPGVKVLLNSIHEGLKLSRNEIKSFKMESDYSPCPQKIIPKLFTSYVLLFKHIGTQQEDNSWKVSWEALKRYSYRVFLESNQRVLNGLELLSKMGHSEIIKSKNEEGDEVVSDIVIKDLQPIEDFAEFYQYHLYKPGKSEPIYVDHMAFKVIKAMVEMAGPDCEVNHKGAVELKYDEFVDYAKSNFRLDIKNTHWDLLEKKGLFIQRKQVGEHYKLLFDKEEFFNTYKFWHFICEIDKWNTKGFIDFSEPKEEIASDGSSCPECNEGITAEQKFCHNCGCGLLAA